MSQIRACILQSAHHPWFFTCIQLPSNHMGQFTICFIFWLAEPLAWVHANLGNGCRALGFGRARSTHFKFKTSICCGFCVHPVYISNIFVFLTFMELEDKISKTLTNSRARWASTCRWKQCKESETCYWGLRGWQGKDKDRHKACILKLQIDEMLARWSQPIIHTWHDTLPESKKKKKSRWRL